MSFCSPTSILVIRIKIPTRLFNIIGFNDLFCYRNDTNSSVVGLESTSFGARHFSRRPVACDRPFFVVEYGVLEMLLSQSKKTKILTISLRHPQMLALVARL